METLIGICIFLAVLLLHFAICRLKKEWRKSRYLIRIFFVVVSVWVIATVLRILPTSFTTVALIRTLLIASSIFLVYLSTFTAVELDSITCLFCLSLKKAGPMGLSQDELVSLLRDTDVILSRLHELESSGLIKKHGARYLVTRKGVLLLRLIRLTRRLFGRGDVGG